MSSVSFKTTRSIPFQIVGISLWVALAGCSKKVSVEHGEALMDRSEMTDDSGTGSDSGIDTGAPINGAGTGFSSGENPSGGGSSGSGTSGSGGAGDSSSRISTEFEADGILAPSAADALCTTGMARLLYNQTNAIVDDSAPFFVLEPDFDIRKGSSGERTYQFSFKIKDEGCGAPKLEAQCRVTNFTAQVDPARAGQPFDTGFVDCWKQGRVDVGDFVEASLPLLDAARPDDRVQFMVSLHDGVGNGNWDYHVAVMK